MTTEAANPFGTRTLVFLIGAGILLAAAVLLLLGFGSELNRAFGDKPGPDSKTGTGFYALQQLIDRVSDTSPYIGRSFDDYETDELLILTPGVDTKREDIDRILTTRRYLPEDAEEGDEVESPTLIILPKWQVQPLPLQQNRVQRVGSYSFGRLDQLVPVEQVEVFEGQSNRTALVRENVGLSPFLMPLKPQLMRSPALVPLIAIHGEGMLFAQVQGHNTYVLADPDLLNNWGLRDKRNARAALDLLAALDPDLPGQVTFDTTLHFQPGDRNLLKLMFTPPFLAVTIALLVAALLAGIATLNRFGPPRREARAVAFGKAALIDNITALTRLAGRTASGGSLYAQATREWLARRLRLARGLSSADLDAKLDALAPPGSQSIDQLTVQLREARSDEDLLRAARNLHDWRKGISE